MSLGYINCQVTPPSKVSQIVGSFLDDYIGHYTARDETLKLRRSVNIGKPRLDRNVVEGYELIVPFSPEIKRRNITWKLTLIDHEIETHYNNPDGFWQVQMLLNANLVNGCVYRHLPRNAELDSLEQMLITITQAQVNMLAWKMKMSGHTSTNFNPMS